VVLVIANIEARSSHSAMLPTLLIVANPSSSRASLRATRSSNQFSIDCASAFVGAQTSIQHRRRRWQINFHPDETGADRSNEPGSCTRLNL
jgi:hypothetical protein